MIRIDMRDVMASLDSAERMQVPFATAKALTACAQAAKVAVTRSLPTVFDRPTPFTMQAVGIRTADKRHLEAWVFIKDRQAKYLELEETGGTRTPPKTALIMPKAAPRNAYGNLPKGALQRMKADPLVFVGKPKGARTGGFYRRIARTSGGGGWQPLAVFISRAVYKPRFGFRERVAKTVRAVFPAAFAEAFQQAMATRRR